MCSLVSRAHRCPPPPPSPPPPLAPSNLSPSHRPPGVIHPKIHGFANWGIDPHDSKCHPYLRKMSVVTTTYNHFGYHNAPIIFSLSVSPAAGRELLSVFEDSLKVPVPEHAETRNLVGHSEVCGWITMPICLHPPPPPRLPYTPHFGPARSYYCCTHCPTRNTPAGQLHREGTTAVHGGIRATSRRGAAGRRRQRWPPLTLP